MENNNAKNVEINRKHDLRILAQVRTQLNVVFETAEHFSRDAEKETKVLLECLIATYTETFVVEKEI